MEDFCNSVHLGYFCEDEGIGELRQYLMYTSELQSTVVAAREEIEKRGIEIFRLKELLGKAIKEKKEAQVQCHQLMLDKIRLQQQLQEFQHQNQHPRPHPQQQMQQQDVLAAAAAPLSVTCSNENEPKASDSSNNLDSPASTNKPIVQFPNPVTDSLELPEMILKLAADKPLPEKGKLLQAVKDAGPLLQTLLLAGPLPQWQHPPPKLDSIEIPPVIIPSPRLIHEDSFNSLSPCLTKKRSCPEVCQGQGCHDSCCTSPNNKHQKAFC